MPLAYRVRWLAPLALLAAACAAPATGPPLAEAHVGHLIEVGGEPGMAELCHDGGWTTVPTFRYQGLTVFVMPLGFLGASEGGEVEVWRGPEWVRTLQLVAPPVQDPPGEATLALIAAVEAVDERGLVPPEDPAAAALHARALANLHDLLPRVRDRVLRAREQPVLVGRFAGGVEAWLDAAGLAALDRYVIGLFEPPIRLGETTRQGGPVALRRSLTADDALFAGALIALGASGPVGLAAAACVALAMTAGAVVIPMMVGQPASNATATAAPAGGAAPAVEEAAALTGETADVQEKTGDCAREAAAGGDDPELAAAVAESDDIADEARSRRADECREERRCAGRCLAGWEICCDEDICLRFQECLTCEGRGPRCETRFSTCCGNYLCDPAERCEVCDGEPTCLPLSDTCEQRPDGGTHDGAHDGAPDGVTDGPPDRELDRACRSAADCDGWVCERGRCRPCATRAECPGQACAGGRCGPCGADRDCAPEVCADGRCVECRSDGECEIGYCSGYRCVGCASDGECGAGRCVAGRCVACRTSDDCSRITVCNASGMCSYCGATAGAACPEGIACNYQRCGNCSTPGQCAGGTYGGAGDRCVAGQCRSPPMCRDGCRDGQRCLGAAGFERCGDCAQHSDCATNNCVSWLCARCATDVDCMAWHQRAEPTGGYAWFCREGRCATEGPACDPAGDAAECRASIPGTCSSAYRNCQAYPRDCTTLGPDGCPGYPGFVCAHVRGRGRSCVRPDHACSPRCGDGLRCEWDASRPTWHCTR